MTPTGFISRINVVYDNQSRKTNKWKIPTHQKEQTMPHINIISSGRIDERESAFP